MSQGESQLAEPVSNDGSDEAAMELLASLRKPEQGESEEEEPEAEVEAEEVAESEETEEGEQEEEAVEEDEDPEIDLGEIKVRKSELKAGYMKDADYRQKTAVAAEAKREAQALAEHVRQEREYLANHVAVTLQAAHKQLIGDQEVLAELARTDPATWVAENAAFQERAAQFNALVQQSQALKQQSSADDERQHAEYRKEQADLLKEKLPEWKDPKVRASETEIIGGYAQRLGYSPKELNELFDHRALLILRDAALADHQRSARASAKDKQVKAEPPKTLKPGAATTKSPTKSVQETQKLLHQARKSQSEDDFVALLQSRRKQS